MSDSVLLGSNLFGRLRALGRRLPILKRVFLPLWNPATHFCWQLRNLVTLRRPLRIDAGRQQVRMYPAGQIAEALWIANFEAAERELVARVTRPGMRVVNIGANAGLYTLITAKLTGAGGEVHAFEPSTTTYALLERNVALNGLANVRTHRLALSDVRGRLVLRSDPRNQSLDGHRFVESLSEGTAVGGADEVIDCDTLDDYFSTKSLPEQPAAIDLLIMDVEGAEWSVLQGGVSVVDHSPNLLMILECSRNRREVEAWLAARQFNFYVWSFATGTLEPSDFVAAASTGTVIAYRGDAARALSTTGR